MFILPSGWPRNLILEKIDNAEPNPTITAPPNNNIKRKSAVLPRKNPSSRSLEYLT